jgi:hypothetical protein
MTENPSLTTDSMESNEYNPKLASKTNVPTTADQLLGQEFLLFVYSRLKMIERLKHVANEK